MKMYGKYRTKEHYNIVLEYCNGGDLKNFIKQYGKLREPMAREIILQLA
jgi:serine/threonine protein kinase